MTRPFRFALLLSFLLVAGCVAVPETPPPPPPVASVPAPAPPVAVGWEDRALTAGGWTYRQSGEGSEAAFGPPERRVRITCSPSRGEVAIGGVPGTGPVTVRTTAATRQVAPADPDGGTDRVTLAARDPLLDAMAFSRGRFVFERAGGPALILPPHAEVGRVIEDCRR